jgi:hypothetical protein
MSKLVAGPSLLAMETVLLLSNTTEISFSGLYLIGELVIFKMLLGAPVFPLDGGVPGRD